MSVPDRVSPSGPLVEAEPGQVDRYVWGGPPEVAEQWVEFDWQEPLQGFADLPLGPLEEDGEYAVTLCLHYENGVDDSLEVAVEVSPDGATWTSVLEAVLPPLGYAGGASGSDAWDRPHRQGARYSARVTLPAGTAHIRVMCADKDEEQSLYLAQATTVMVEALV